ncbi:MAG: BREX-6 system adenine-specific DNA-methyltransferase PglX, partial [bacterium]|nr:BREX-6 system adenine-specific DNA-methyltransferase PglX [bacterium]
DLPGLFGKVELVELFPTSPAMLRRLVEALDQPELRSAWGDDTTLGWVYQYWNDPEREALDAKLHAGGKVEPHEIASKTQMFTERYMVEWLLHNSLGQIWLAMCRKHGWTPEVEARGTLDALDARRVEWRRKREAGEVALDELMPIHNSLEDRWKYWVPQPLPDDAVAAAPERLEDLRILDPACGSGHFLVIAFDLLHELYQEQARHRRERVDHRAITERILERNLHGIDLDPRAVQIAAAALLVKAWQACPEARPRRLQLVASNLKLGALAHDDPALVELRRAVREETGLPEELTDRIVGALAGADHLGSLLKVGKEVRGAIEEFIEKRREENERASQTNLFEDDVEIEEIDVDVETLMEALLTRLETFLAGHTGGDDLGLRLHGEQLAAGMRFVRLLREDTYDLVVGNPPYQGTSRMVDAAYVKKHYPRGKADLYAAFLERGLELAKPGGMSAMLTMRNWMFITQFSDLREEILNTYDLRMIGDVDRGAFDEVPNELLAAAMSITRKAGPCSKKSVAMQPTTLDDKSYDRQRTHRKRAAVLAQVGRSCFATDQFSSIKNHPIVYWWSGEEIEAYREKLQLSDKARVAQGISTTRDERFVVRPWEPRPAAYHRLGDPLVTKKIHRNPFVPLIKGIDSDSQRWIEPLLYLVRWNPAALAIRILLGAAFRSPDTHFEHGVAYTAIGNTFHSRVHRFRSICHNKGSSVFHPDVAKMACLMNSSMARRIIQSLNPGLGFEVGDVKRLPFLEIDSAEEILDYLQRCFAEHEAHRETSVEFQHPGPSCWRHAQDWAQRAVDRDQGDPLPPWEPAYDDEPAIDHVSYAFGVALGRFGRNGEGILDEAPADALDDGVLFLNALHPDDDLAHPACASLHDAWAEHGPRIDPKRDLDTWLRERFFQDDHRKRYEDRPIYLPLSSKNRTFVAWLSIHRCHAQTLPALLLERLRPALTVVEGELDDLREARNQGDAKAQARASRREDELVEGRAELLDFIAIVRRIAEQGPPPAKPSDPPRQADATFLLDLDDGVMIHSAALWPLIEPQGWKKPRQWWSELCCAKGKKDYDWAHLTRRYFPARVEAKCAQDPSLAVAHGCFWRLHPAKAYEWELRLQDEIGPDFTLDEEDSDTRRAAFLDEHPDQAAAVRAAEAKRRERKRKKQEKDAAEEAARRRGPGIHGPLLRS